MRIPMHWLIELTRMQPAFLLRTIRTDNSHFIFRLIRIKMHLAIISIIYSRMIHCSRNYRTSHRCTPTTVILMVLYHFTHSPGNRINSSQLTQMYKIYRSLSMRMCLTRRKRRSLIKL